MNKTYATGYIADKCGTSKRLAGDMINCFLECITESLKKNGRFSLTGFGTFKVSHRKARTGVNPQNPSQKIQIAARNVATFKAGTELKASVN